jgi:hypothetical protein
MNDSQFFELLNLYLDHEISAADAARLEAEVQANPGRREIYRQYCRMQKACTQLSAEFQTEAAAATDSSPKLIAFDPNAAAASRRRSNAPYVFGAFAAAAACVAVIFVSRGQQDAVGSVPVRAELAQSVSVPAAAPVSARVGLVSVASRTHAERPGATLVSNPLLLKNSPAEAVMAAALNDANQQLAWIHNLQLAPLQRGAGDQLRFEPAPATLRPEARALNSGRAPPAEASVELAAFRFVK